MCFLGLIWILALNLPQKKVVSDSIYLAPYFGPGLRLPSLHKTRLMRQEFQFYFWMKIYMKSAIYNNRRGDHDYTLSCYRICVTGSFIIHIIIVIFHGTLHRGICTYFELHYYLGTSPTLDRTRCVLIILLIIII